MQYYYSLLENYEQLKRRQFKLSLREEEGKKMSDEEKIQDLTSKAGEDREKPGTINGVNVYKRGNDVLGFDPGGGPQPQTASLVKDGQLGKSPAALKLLGMMYGSGEGEEGGDKDKGADQKDTSVQEPVDPAKQAAEAEATRVETLQADIKNEQLPGYDPASRYSRFGRAVALARKKISGETEAGEGINKQAASFEDEDVRSKIISSPELDQEQVRQSTKSLADTLEMFKKVQAGDKVTAQELRDVTSKLEVTPQGIMFDGIYFQYRSQANSKNDPYVNIANQLNQQIVKNNEKLKGLDKDSDAYKEGYVSPIVSENRGRVLSNRGPLLEQTDVIAMLASKLADCKEKGIECPDTENKIGEVFEKATEGRSVEELEELLKKGLCSTAGQCLVDIKGAEDTVITGSVFQFLTGKDANGNDLDMDGSPKLSDEVATTLIEEASKNGSKALALIVLSSRAEFNGPFKGLDIVDAEQLGGVGANLKGQKDDIGLILTDESYKELMNRIEAYRSDVEKKQAEKAKCAGEGVGLVSEMAEPQKGQRKVGVEKKSVDSLGSRTKAGEGNNKKFKEACGGAEPSDELEKQFLETNDRRLANCQGNMSFGRKGRTAKQAACNFQEKVDSSPTLTTFDSIAGGGYITDDDGNKVEGAGQALVDQWAASSNMKKAERDQRAKLAKSAFAKLSSGGTLSSAEKEALSKVRDNLEQAEISKQLDAETGPNGEVTGEALGYLLYRQAQDSGSLEECVKNVCSYGDGEQRIGLINEGVYGSFGMVCDGDAVVRRQKGSNSFSVETKDGTKMMGGSFERGQMVSKVEPSALGNPKKSKSQNESLFFTFLKSQQELIEKLMHQTKTGPNP